jgi:hypothetical protein
MECHSPEMLGIKMLSFERNLQEQTSSVYNSELLQTMVSHEDLDVIP